MKIFFDTEFIEDGKTIDLISIGLVREDGHYYYALNNECDYSKAGDWVAKNVLPHLTTGPYFTRAEIAADIRKFAGQQPEFWAYYADYDWVALCQLYGRMVDLPNSWPMFCRDVKQLCMDKGNPRLPERGRFEHHALEDARWALKAWEFLNAARPEALAQKDWLIWSNEHRAWWGPGHCGYPKDVRLAGRYTLDEANAICTQRSWEDLNVPPETMIHLRAVIGDELYGQCMNSGGEKRG